MFICPVPKSTIKPGQNRIFHREVVLKVDSKRIIVSHSRVFEDEKPEAKEAAAEKRAKKSSKKEQAETSTQSNVEKTTLGDIEELAALKEKLSGDNK